MYIPRNMRTTYKYQKGIESNPKILSNIPNRFKTYEMCLTAIKKDSATYAYIPRRFRYLCVKQKQTNNVELILLNYQYFIPTNTYLLIHTYQHLHN
jgi:hypothetical protein